MSWNARPPLPSRRIACATSVRPWNGTTRISGGTVTPSRWSSSTTRRPRRTTSTMRASSGPRHTTIYVGETVERYDENFWRNGHAVPLVVLDDSSPATHDKYYAGLERTKTHNDLRR